MRQIVNLRQNISRRKVIDRYPLFHFLASLQGGTIKPLEEILDPEAEPKGFDDATDAVLEKRALELLEKQKRALNG